MTAKIVKKPTRNIIFYLKRFKNYFIIGSVILIALCFIAAYWYYHSNLYYISLMKTEGIKEAQQHSIPSDVKKALSEKEHSNLPQPVLGTTAIRVPILMYHYVEWVKDKRDTIRQSLTINPTIFEAQIETLKNAGYTFMTAKDLGDVLDGKIKLPPNPILITIDDGHWDVDTDILPILKKYDVKATSYVVPGFIGGSDFMSSEQLQDVIKSGLIEIGAHTVHHVSLRGQPLQTVVYEVNHSKQMLENEYHIHVVSFAYPYGTFDNQAISVVKNAGFETAVSTIPGIEQTQDNRYFLYRLRPGARTGIVLLNWLKQKTFNAY